MGHLQALSSGGKPPGSHEGKPQDLVSSAQHEKLSWGYSIPFQEEWIRPVTRSFGSPLDGGSDSTGPRWESEETPDERPFGRGVPTRSFENPVAVSTFQVRPG